MSSTRRENAALVREFITDVLAGGDLDALDVFLSDAAVDHYPPLAESPVPAMQATVYRVLGAADVDIAIEEVVAESEMVAVRGTVSGSHRASIVDTTATGRTFEISYAWFCRIEEGQIAEIWSVPDGPALQRAVRRDDDQRNPDETPQN